VKAWDDSPRFYGRTVVSREATAGIASAKLQFEHGRSWEERQAARIPSWPDSDSTPVVASRLWGFWQTSSDLRPRL